MYSNCTESGYSKEVDVWSAGVLLFFLLSGNLPFTGECVREQVLSGKFEFAESWNDKSETVKSYIKQFLCVDPARRISVSDALSHVWITTNSTTEDPDDRSLEILEIENERIVTSSPLKRKTNELIDLTRDSPPKKRRKLTKSCNE